MTVHPATKITILFILGIVLQPYFNPPLYILLFLCLVYTILFIKKEMFLKYRIVLPAFFYIIIILLGSAIKDNQPKTFALSDALVKERAFLYGKIKFIELIRKDEISIFFVTDSGSIGDFNMAGDVKLVLNIKDENSKLDSIYNQIYPGYSVLIKGIYYKGKAIRNPGEFDYNKYLLSKGISGIINLYSVDSLTLLDKTGDLLSSKIFIVRKTIDETISRFHNKASSALLRGLILGDRTEMAEVSKTAFINSGVVHVLAVSGLHVGYIVLIFLIIFGRFNLILRYMLTICGVILFTIITGMQSSALRASLMFIIITTAYLTNRSKDILNSISISALIILIINPDELFAAGFQLSYSAVISLCLVYPYFKEKISSYNINKRLKQLLLYCAITFSAQAGTLPFTLYYFGKFSIVSIIANLIVIPLTGLIVGIAAFTLIISTLLPSLAAYYGLANNFLIKGLNIFITALGDPAYSFLWVRQFSILDGVIFYLISAFYLIISKSLSSYKVNTAIIFMMVTSIIALTSIDNKDYFQKNKFNMLMIDVGQGDAFLIQFPNGRTALIDAGESNKYFDTGEKIIIPILDYLGIDKIDYGFISHMDTDHYSGFVTLAQKNRVHRIYKPAADSTGIDIRFTKFLKNNDVPIKYYEPEIIKEGNVKIYILTDYLGFDSTYNSNDKSAVIKIIYGKTAFLFTGDAEIRSEKIYIEKKAAFLKSNVLKISHHGSNTATSKEFIKYVEPEYALISAGYKNKFSHPSSEVIELLKENRVKIFRTDQIGAILLNSDGVKIEQLIWKE